MAEQLSEYQRDILARTILGEARGEGTTGMVAVAHTILNRANSGQFPSDPAKVALQNKQFSVWNSGAGGGKTNYDKNSQEYKTALQVVDAVASGAVPDITNGALYYHTPAVSPSWSSGVNRYGTNQIGNHIFYNGRPTPPGDIPAVASMLSVNRQSPTPNALSSSAAAIRQMTSPSGGNSELQTALNQVATRERNRVSPQIPPARSVQTVATIPTTSSLTSPGAINASVGGLAQDSTLAAALARRNQFSDDPGIRAQGSVVASIPTRTATSASDRVRGQSAPPSLFNGDPLIPASGQVVATIPTRAPVTTPQRTSGVGQPPATRSVQSVSMPPVSTATGSAAKNINNQRLEQQVQRSAPALPNQAQLAAATGFRVPQAASFSYAPTPVVPDRLTAGVLPNAPVVPQTMARLPSLPLPTIPSRVAPIPATRPNQVATQLAVTAPRVAVARPVPVAAPRVAQRVAPVPFSAPVRSPVASLTSAYSGGGSSYSPAPSFVGTATGNTYNPGTIYQNGNGSFIANSNGTFTNIETGRTSGNNRAGQEGGAILGGQSSGGFRDYAKF